MTAKSIFSGVLKGLAIAGLVVAIGCGRDEKEAKDLANEGNQKLAAADATIKEMNTLYGINLLPVYPKLVDENLKTFNWSRFAPEQRETIRAKLISHRQNIDRIKEITYHKNIRSGVDRASLEMSATYAQKYLDALDAAALAGISNPAPEGAAAAGSPESNLRIVEARELEAKLLASAAILEGAYSLSLAPLADGGTANRDWSGVEEAKLSEIKARLEEYQINTDRLIELTNEGVVVVGLEKKKASRELAAEYLKGLNDFEMSKMQEKSKPEEKT